MSHIQIDQPLVAVSVVDIADNEIARCLGATRPDYRFTLVLPGGAEATLNSGATAADVIYYLRREAS